MTYEEAIEYIESIQKFGSKLELYRITRLLGKLGNPQDELKIIHIAGTNGKGSTCAMMSSILQAQGYSVGLYTSPHLESYTERIQISRQNIIEHDFAEVTEVIKRTSLEMLQQGEGHPTVFECLTAMALYYFYQKKVDFVVLEVGLGGRYDATNIIKAPLLSVITAIGMDHVEFLGDTIEKITYEKAGIIKEKCPVVLYYQSETVYNIINDICQKMNSHLFYIQEQELEILHQTLYDTIFTVSNKYFSYEHIRLSLIGNYQVQNACTALLAVEALRAQGILIDPQSVYRGLQEVYWHGRMEIFSVDPMVILDGAHNADGIHALKNIIMTYFPHMKVTLLFGVLQDKSYRQMLEILLPVIHTVVVTQPNNDRALSASSLGAEVSQYPVTLHIEKDIDHAVRLALEITKKEEILICAGSLYLIGDVRRILLKDKT